MSKFIAFKITVDDNIDEYEVFKHVKAFKGVTDVTTYGQWVDFKSKTDTPESSIARFHRRNNDE